ncbi:MAG: winged helix DNA-binding domain-containing protein [Actinomycetota bacterium]|nr:winged helix DNA-binding domain-containing protein [Actinomycetota bacterium]
MLRRLGAVQIDAVNVLVRSHYLPLFSRLGPYPLATLDRLVHEQRAAFEYWAHAASLVPVQLYPALRWRMTAADAERDAGWARFLARVESERPGYAAAVLAEVTDRGPLTFSELTDPARRPKENPNYAAATMLWDRGSDGKSVLEYLYDSGRLAVSGRRGFDRLFDLTERVIPADVLAAPALGREDAQRLLVEHAARALGVAAVPELADYFRLPVAATRARIRELVEAGSLQAVAPVGWSEPGYLPVAPWPSRRPPECVLLSPFDSLLWHRKRTVRIFGFTHSFEIYLPAAKRKFGYYVLPILLGDRLVGRVDLKADRDAPALLVRGAYAEPGVDADEVAGPLARELAATASWLGLGEVVVTGHGDLAPALTAELA